MSKVKRYTVTKFNSEGWDTPVNEIGVFEADRGEYVRFADYDTLEGEKLCLDRDLAEMRRQCDEAKARVALLEAELREVLGDAPYIFSKRVDSIVAALTPKEPRDG